MHLGRQELLGWINEQAEAVYPTIEALGDGVAFAQILDKLHPGSIVLVRMNLSSRISEDNLRNMRVVEEALRKLKVDHKCSLERISQGKFQDIIQFVQWLHTYSFKHGINSIEDYPAYSKRIEILQKQRKNEKEMSSYLKPNFIYQEDDINIDEHYEIEHFEQEEEVALRAKQLELFVNTLENDLTKKMELNWRLMLMLDQSIEERNILYSLLQTIHKCAKEAPNTTVKTEICKLLEEIPREFK